MSTSASHWPYDVLGLSARPTDKRAVKRAYAKRLKQIDQATDPQGFQNLREAYEAALRYFEYGNTPPVPPPLPIETAAPQEEMQEIPVTATTVTPDNSWVRAQELCDQISAPLAAEKGVERLRRIFNDPVFQDIHAAQILEQAVFDYVQSKLHYVEQQLELSPQIDRDMLQLIDDRFGWYSDSVAFQNRFFVSQELMGEIARELGPAGGLETPLHRFQGWFHKATVFLGKPLVWIGWVVAIFVFANIFPKPIASPIIGWMVLIPIAIFIGMFVWSFIYILLSPLFWPLRRLYRAFRNYTGWW